MRSLRTAPLGFALVLFAAIASAQPTVDPVTPPNAAVPAVVPPRPLTPLTADYPEGAAGDAVVILAVTVNADGSVRSARVAEGDEPFAAAALAAASHFQFEPAMRKGKPVAAAIQIEVRFTAPIAMPAEPAPANSAPPPAPPGAKPPAPPPEPIEVTVRGELAPPGATSLARAEVRLLPGAFGDPFRAIEMLPGVTPIASGLPFFYVRGAPPGNVGYFLDGVRVPLLYHLGLGPSVVNPALVDRVDLYPGAYPARFGRFAGGIVAGETREPADQLHGEANLRLVDAGAFVESPFAGGRGSAAVGGRYSYTAALLSLLQSVVVVQYWDYQARLSFDLTPRDRISVFTFGAYDYLGEKQDEGGTKILFDTMFHRVDLRYDHRFGPASTLRQAVTFGFDQTRLPQGSFARDRMVATRSEVTHRLGDDVVLRAGLDAVIDDIGVDVAQVSPGSGFSSTFKSRLDFVAGARVDAVVQVTPRLEFTPGFRIDFYGSAGQTEVGVDPRLAWKLTLLPWLRLVPAFGLASQPPSFILPGPGFTVGLRGGLQRSVQASARVEADLPAEIEASVTAFQNGLYNLTDALGSNPVQGSDLDRPFRQRTQGSSVGMEITLRRRLTKRLGGFLAYTLARSERVVPRYEVVSESGVVTTVRERSARVPSSFDRTHVLNAALGYDFGRGFRAGARLVLYTGYPRTSQGGDPPFSSITYDDRLPPFVRLDLRFEKKWSWSNGKWLSLVLEGQNVTLTKEVLSVDCSSGKCEEETIGPVSIPSIGLEGGL